MLLYMCYLSVHLIYFAICIWYAGIHFLRCCTIETLLFIGYIGVHLIIKVKEKQNILYSKINIFGKKKIIDCLHLSKRLIRN